jgi:hypothetical protein
MLTRTVLVFALFALACFGGDLNGKWSAKVQSPNGELDVTYTFKVEDGKITGEVSSHMGEFKITEGTVTGDDVNFILTVSMNGEERKVPHKGKLDGDSLKMTLDMGGQEIPVEAKRAS